MARRKEDVWVVRMVLLLSGILALHPAVAWAQQDAATASSSAAPASTGGTEVKPLDWGKIAWRGGLFVANWAAFLGLGYLLFYSGITALATVAGMGAIVIGIILMSLAAVMTSTTGGRISGGSGFGIVATILAYLAVTGLAAWVMSGWIYDWIFGSKKESTSGSRVRTAGIVPILDKIGE